MRIACLILLCGTSAVSAADLRYLGICEASGGVFIDSTRFAIASDESNVIQIYQRGRPTAVASVDLKTFTGYDKSDLEGAAVGNGAIYWSASQSKSSSGNDKKRKVIFETRIVKSGGTTTLEPIGVVREDLKPKLVELSGSTDESINIEGLASTPDGGLLFGFRNLVDKRAAVVKLRNADYTLAAAANQAEFGATARLDLGGRGIRSLERVGDRYLIVAGKPTGGDDVGYALYWWGGEPGDAPKAWETQPDFSGLDPEIAMPLPDRSGLQIVSDDGDRCGFSSVDVPL